MLVVTNPLQPRLLAYGVASLLCFSLLSTVNAVLGPISTTRPSPPGGSIANDNPPNSFFQMFQPPYPTDDWWVGYAAGTGDAWVAGPFPYQSSLLANSIRFGVSTSRDFDGTSIHQPSQADWTAGFVEHSGAAGDHKALAWDTQTVTIQYFNGSSALTSYMVPGSPYMTFNYASATPKLTSVNGLITSFAGQTVTNGGAAVQSTGTKFKVVNSSGTYIIYALSGPLTLSATAASGGGTIVASAKYSGVLRIAKLAAAGHETTLDTYVANYATAVTTDYSFSGDNSVLTFTWTVTGNAGNLLHLTWPHHRLAMSNAAFLPSTSISYLTTKGYMLGTVGNKWSMNYALPTISWNAPRSPDSSCTSTIIQGLTYEVDQLTATPPSAPGDFYWWGGSTAAKARLALIADHIGRTDLRDRVVTWLKAAFEFWFSSSASTLAAYETAWGGIINKAGYNNVWVDYGNGYYNDHHFHYGYFLMVAATIGKFDAGWFNSHREFITYFARDIGNPSHSDPYFTPTRHRDWFAGHSWASGIANGAGARDQESVGEAVNGYYGLLLYADVIGNNDLKNYARLLVATEQQAAKVYWHLYPAADPNARDQPYPEAGLRNLVTIGNVQDWQAGAWLFWGGQKVQIAAIQILPVTPINEYMYDTTWVQNVYSYTSGELNDPAIGDEWKSVIYLAYSQANPQVAASRSTSLTSWGTGNTFTNQVYFLSTRPNSSGGAICGSLQTNPSGNFVFRHTTSDKFVTSSGSRTELFADATAQSGATTYKLAFATGGGTIYAQNNAQYVTADASGNYTIAAARAVASTWEIFTIRQKIGAATGVYSILAASNKKYITVGSNGALINNGDTEASSAGFQLVSV
ncbi:glycoside hydrolase family 81 protein [Serendipita vermifera]|nr:glycoside hydrolase family 81 protein [Serendipita vermifera]